VSLAAHSTGWALDPVGELDLDLDVGRDLEGDATARSGQLDFVLGQGGAMRPQRLGRRVWQRKPFEE